MSAPNAARALPPGDRTPMPDTAPELGLALPPVASPPSSPSVRAMLGGAVLVRDRLFTAITEAAAAVAALERAEIVNDLSAYQAAASKLAELPDIKAMARSFAKDVDRALSAKLKRTSHPLQPTVKE